MSNPEISPVPPGPGRQAPPAGWYASGPVQRWWDGQQWTEHTQAFPQQQPVAPTQQVIVNTGPRALVISGMTGGEAVAHWVMIILTCGLWYPIYRWRRWSLRRLSTFQY